MLKITQQPFLLKTKIMHSRLLPKKNYFNYSSLHMAIPLQKILHLNNFLFSVNKFNLYGLSSKNYTFKSLNNIENWINDILKQHNITQISNVVLVTHPCILGYVFNPASFWLCFNESQQLIAVLSEVNNRSKQRHHYLCFNANGDPILSNQWLVAKKVFHVSPFFKVEGEYKFRFDIKNDEMNFYINYIVDGKLNLTTSVKCKCIKWSNYNFFISFVKIPFATLKTTILIHYQALKLFCKGIKFNSPPPQNKINISSNYDKK